MNRTQPTAIKPSNGRTEPASSMPRSQPEDCLRAGSGLPRIAMVSTHGYVAAQPPLGAADTGGQVVYA